MFFSLAVFFLLLSSLYSSLMFRSTPCSLEGCVCIGNRCCLSSTSNFVLNSWSGMTSESPGAPNRWRHLSLRTEGDHFAPRTLGGQRNNQPRYLVHQVCNKYAPADTSTTGSRRPGKCFETSWRMPGHACCNLEAASSIFASGTPWLHKDCNMQFVVLRSS